MSSSTHGGVGTFLRSTEGTGEKWRVFIFLSTNDSCSHVLSPSWLFALTANAQISASEAGRGVAQLFLGLSRWSDYSFWHMEPFRQGGVGKRALGK